MFSLARAVAAACAALMLAAAVPAHAAESADPKRGDFERMLREYLAEHPEAIQDALDTLAARKAAAKAEQQKAAVKANRGELFSSPRQVTLGNHAGDVTLVEFFDYNCGYCKRALTDLIQLMKNDPKLKVVLKEYPILGPDSVEAARVAVAVRMQDAGDRYLAFHRKLLENRGHNDKARALAAAEEAGFDMARLERDMASEEVTNSLDESTRLGKALAINGTPGYVVGERVIVGGALGEQVLKDSIAVARKQ